MRTGMNLGTSSKRVCDNDDVVKGRVERLQQQEYREYRRKKHMPYNRTFGKSITDNNDVEIMSRSEQKEYDRSVKFQSGFLSTVMVVFSAVVILLFVGAIAGKSLLDKYEPQTGGSEMMIQETSEIEVEVNDVYVGEQDEEQANNVDE